MIFFEVHNFSKGRLLCLFAFGANTLFIPPFRTVVFAGFALAETNVLVATNYCILRAVTCIYT
jgi:hypothetical protein